MKQYLKKHKFTLALALILALIFANTDFGFTYAAGTHWSDDVFKEWVDKGLLSAKDVSDFRPDDKITRAEFMAFVNSAFDYNIASNKVERYQDVKTSDWYYKVVAIALAEGYINGVDDKHMNPNGPITREQAMAIMARLSNSPVNYSAYKNASDGDMVSSWARKAVSTCISQGFISGNNGQIKPLAKMTRAEAMVMLNRKINDERTFGLAGTYDLGHQKINYITISASGTTVKNANVMKDLTITKEVGDGDVNLVDVNILKNFYVYGGGINSVHVNNLHVDGAILLDRHDSAVRLVANGASKANRVVLDGSATLDNQTQQAVSFKRVDVSSKVPENKDVSLLGNYQKITNSGKNLTLAFAGNIDDLSLDNNTVLTGNVKVEKLKIDPNSEVKVKTPNGKMVVLDSDCISLEINGNSIIQNKAEQANSKDDDDDEVDDDDDDDYTETTISEKLVLSLDKVAEEINFDLVKGSNTKRAQVTEDLVLPNSLGDYKDVSITWESSEPSVVSADGKVMRAENLTEVTLTAILSRDGETAEGYVWFIVKAKDK